MPPALKALGFFPNVIDTTMGAAELTLGFAVSSDTSAPNYFEAVFVDPTGVGRQSAVARFAPALDGTYSAKITFPRFSNAGTWTLSHVVVGDVAGNTLILDEDGLRTRGFPTRLEVKSARDSVSPKLASLEFTPSPVDTTMGPADVHVSFTATDDFSGVNYIELVFVSPTGVARRGGSLKLDPALSVSKSMTLTFPRRSEAGNWTLKTLFLSDAANNTLVLDAERLQAMGFRTTLEVISTPDTQPPSLVSLSFTPDSIDTSQGAANVKVAFRATDDISGIQSLEVVFEGPTGVAKQRATAQFPSPNGISDSIQVAFPQFSEPGRWNLNAVFLADSAGNTLSLDAAGLAGMGIRTTLNVESAPDTKPPSLTALAFTPDAIDTSRNVATVDVKFTATDDVSGVKSIEVVFASPDGSARVRGSSQFSPKREVTDTIKVMFPPFSQPGAWKLESVVVTDAGNNTMLLDSDALRSRVGKSLQVR